MLSSSFSVAKGGFDQPFELSHPTSSSRIVLHEQHSEPKTGFVLYRETLWKIAGVLGICPKAGLPSRCALLSPCCAPAWLNP